MKIKGDILITDPCYWMKDDVFEKYCMKLVPGTVQLLNPIENMQGMLSDTLYGDWKCTVYKTDKDITQETLENIIEYSLPPVGEVVGTFTADAGLVSISEYNETWDYNKKKAEELVDKYTRCATVLEDFDGDVIFVDIYTKDCDTPMRCIIGKGNYNFYTLQTGF